MQHVTGCDNGWNGWCVGCIEKYELAVLEELTKPLDWWEDKYDW